MTPLIKELKESNTRAIDQTLKQYYDSAYGQSVLAVWKLGLDGSKAKSALGLVSLYEAGPTTEVGWTAFRKLAKAFGEKKVRAVLTEMGKTPPARGPLTKDEIEERKKALASSVKRLETSISGALSYFESAIESVNKDGLPYDDREVNGMFDRGRRRADQVYTLYNEIILKNKDFGTLYPKLVADKKKVDAKWSAYRTAISTAEKRGHRTRKPGDEF
jgi:hypothetical protein